MKILSIPQQTVQQFKQTRSNLRLKKQVDTFLGSLRMSDTNQVELSRLNALGVRLCIDRKIQKQYVEISHPEANKPLAVGYQKARSYRLFHAKPADTWQLNNFRAVLKKGNSSQEALRLTPEEKHALLMQLNAEVHRGNERQPSVPLFSYLKGELVDIPESYRFTPAAPRPSFDAEESIFVQTVFVESDSDTDSVVGPLEEATRKPSQAQNVEEREDIYTDENINTSETEHPLKADSLAEANTAPATESHEIIPTTLNL